MYGKKIDAISITAFVTIKPIDSEVVFSLPVLLNDSQLGTFSPFYSANVWELSEILQMTGSALQNTI